MNPRSTLPLVALALACGTVSRGAAQPDQIEFFEKNIRPILADNCLDCHGAHKHENGLRFDTQAAVTKGSDYGVVIVPGNPAASKLVKAIRHMPGVEAMPKKREALKPEQIALIEKWIQNGAAWPEDKVATSTKPKWQEHWAFQRVTKPAVPAVTSTGSRNPIDRFVAAKLAEKGLKPAPPAEAATLCRRLYLDVTGLLPTYEQVQAFTADHKRDAQAAVGRLVTQLLASPHYGERWARYWLDVARYSDTEGYQVAGKDIRYPYAYTYRDWVISSLNADMGYDRFVTLQLAADKLIAEEQKAKGQPPAPSRDLAALGFLTVNDTFIGSKDLQTDDRIDVTGRGLLGLTVGCARCHDHKYDPVPSKDYYALYSVFNSSQVPNDLPVIGKPASDAAFASYQGEVSKVEAKKSAYRQEVYDDMRKPERLAAYLSFVHEATVKNLEDSAYRGRAGQLQLRDRVAKKWHTLVQQTAATHPAMIAWSEFAKLPDDQFAAKATEVMQRLESPDSKCIPEVVNAFKSKPAPKSFDDVAATYAALFLKHQVAPAEGKKDGIHEMLMRPASPMVASVDSMEDFFTRKDMEHVVQMNNQLKRLEITSPGAPPRAMVMTDKDKPNDVRVFIRGNPARPGDIAPRANLTFLGGQKFNDGSGRLELARSIVNRDNPLAARVMVNRVWMQHFGKPIVPNPSDFGVQTARPDHVALLDYLAATFMEEGWSLKKLHHLILTSATWQQSSQSTPDKDLKDAENNLVSRFNRTRLDYEAMRDAIAQVTSTLNQGLMGGRSVPLNAADVDSWRTVYQFVDRYDQATVPAMFDFANPDGHSPQRITTTVPQQALFLMNSPFMQKQAGSLAAKLPITGSTPDSETVKTLYRRTLSRDPKTDELDLAQRFLSEAGSLQNEVAFRWAYGTERLQRDAAGKVTLTDWKPFAVLKDQHKRPTWSHTGTVPDPQWHYAMIHESGGHAPAGDLVCTMRWTAPEDAMLEIKTDLSRDSERGNGVRGLILSSRNGLVAEAVADPQHKKVELNGRVAVKKGDVLHFALSSQGETDSDSYNWTARINALNPDGTVTELTNSKTDFCGTDRWPLNRARPQSPLAQLTQALIMSNEFMFVD
jgi:hypothetical protein